MRQLTAELKDAKASKTSEQGSMNERVMQEMQRQLDELKEARDRQDQMLKTVKDARSVRSFGGLGRAGAHVRLFSVHVWVSGPWDNSGGPGLVRQGRVRLTHAAAGLVLFSSFYFFCGLFFFLFSSFSAVPGVSSSAATWCDPSPADTPSKIHAEERCAEGCCRSRRLASL